MLRAVPAVWTVALAFFATSAVAQTAADSAIARSNAQLSAGDFSDARVTVMTALGKQPSTAERERLLDQLDRVSDATPFFISLELAAEITSGTRQGLFDDRLTWAGVPHYTDDTLSVKAAEAGQINRLGVGAGYTFELTPDLELSLGVDGELNFYEDTDFMEAWIGQAYAALDLSFGPILSNTTLAYGVSSKSREKDDANPNVPRVPGAYHMSVAQDLGFKFAKDQVVGGAFTYRLGDETENVQFPGTQYDHFTLEAYYDARWAETLDTRLFGYVQGASTDPTYTGFQAVGGGLEMAMDLPLGFGLGGDVQYRIQNGAAAFPGRSEALDLETIKGSLRFDNSHYSLRGFRPYLSAGFEESTANYQEYTESHLSIGAGVRLGF